MARLAGGLAGSVFVDLFAKGPRRPSQKWILYLTFGDEDSFSKLLKIKKLANVPFSKKF